MTFNGKELLGGKKTLSAFTNDNMPIYLHNKSYQFEHDEKSGRYYLTCSLLSKEGKKKYGLDRIKFALPVRTGS